MQTATPPQPHMIVLDPGHSHAAAVFANEVPGISDQVDVYAAPGPEVNAFLRSLSQFNSRPSNPSHWRVASHLSPDFLTLFKNEPPHNIVVISGRNNIKIEQITASIRAGQNVLADKPWIINSRDLPQLETALKAAAQKHLIAYDCMTERFNFVYQLQRELMRDEQIFGRPETGTLAEPAVTLQNIHSLIKYDGHGDVSLRPSWFLDVHQQGQAIADVGTHLVDLAFWTLFPDQPINYKKDVQVLRATRSPIFLSKPEFTRLTGERDWPAFLHPSIHDGRLEYDCNNTAVFSIRGIHSSISNSWEYESKGALSDTYVVLYRGTRAAIRVRQSKLENYVPQIVLLPNAGQNTASWKAAVETRLRSISPDLKIQQDGHEFHVAIPDSERGGSTFNQLVAQFLRYVQNPGTLPAWEESNLLAKYYVTTKAAELAAQ